MRITIGNIKCRAEYGGRDYLLKLPKKIDEYLSVKIKNSFFVQKHTGRKWDGMRHFINAKGEFATGFFPLVYNFAKELGADIELIDQRTNLPVLKPEFDFDLPMFDDPAAPHQRRMVQSVDNYIEGLFWPRGIWDAATNARKTATFAMVVNSVVRPKVLFLVHNTDLFDQHYEFYSQLYDVSVITSKKYEIGDFTMAMVKTLYNRMKASLTVQRDLKNYFNIVCVDECHRAGAPEYSQVLQKVDAGMRIFMSGTPLDSDDDVTNMIVVGLSGQVLCKVSKKELMDAGISLRPTVHFYLSPANNSYLSYEDEYLHLIKTNRERAEMIAQIVSERPTNKILINYVEKEHGEFMFNVLRTYPDLKNIFIEWVHGGDPERERKIADFKAGRITVLLSSVIMQEGINIADINTLIYAQGGKAKTPLSQWSGRTERHDGVSTGVEIIDIWDRGKYLSNHSNHRKLFWMREEFEIIYHYEQRNGRPNIQNR